MTTALRQLLTLLQPEQLDEHRFRGYSKDIGLPRVFGGQILGQALYAAQQSVPRSRQIHALHSYFLLPANYQSPIIYQTEIVRDGRSFSTRRVNAFQQDQCLFTMMASFQACESGFEHQQGMPPAPAPESLINETAIYQALTAGIPAEQQQKRSAEQPLDIRPVEFYNPFDGHNAPPVRQIWLRAHGHMPDNPPLAQCLLAYMADRHFLPTALQPHGMGFLQPGMQVATINHAMWFQRPFNPNNWLLYHIESPSAINGRGLVRGEFYSADGQLIACCAQEGIIRRWSDDAEPA